MPPKITINGKEIDIANLPPELKNLAAMSPELKELMADKDGNGVPDIADNPFAMLGKLGQLSSIAKDMPVLMSSIKTPTAKKDPAGFAAESSSAPSLKKTTLVPARQKLPAQYFASASPPIKKDTGRMVLFWMALLGLVGWYVWQSMIK